MNHKCFAWAIDFLDDLHQTEFSPHFRPLFLWLIFGLEKHWEHASLEEIISEVISEGLGIACMES